MQSLGRATIGLVTTYIIVSGLCYLLLGPVASIAVCLLLLGVISYSHMFFEKKLSKYFQLQQLPDQNPYAFSQSIYKYCNLAKLNKPTIYTSPQAYDQAFTFGSSYNKQAIVIFSQLLDKLNPKELDTLAALLVAQIKNKSSMSNTISSLFISFVFLATQSLDELFRFLTGIRQNPLKKRANFITYLNSPFIYIYLCLFHPPSQLFKADKLASEWLENKQSITRLLLKLHTYSFKQTIPPPFKYSHLFLTSPLTPLKWTTYLTWQPNVKKRTLELVGHYPA